MIRAFERAAERAPGPQADRVDFGGGRVGLERRATPACVLAPAHWSAPLLLGSRTAAARKTQALTRLMEILRESGAPEGARCGPRALPPPSGPRRRAG